VFEAISSLDGFLTFSKIVALWAGGLFAAWKWGFGEFLRKKREVPALEGPMTVEVLNLPDNKGLFVLHSVWRNVGSYPVYIDFKETCVTVAKANQTEVNGAKDVEDRECDFWNPVGAISRPLEHLKKYYVLEPNTESNI